MSVTNAHTVYHVTATQMALLMEVTSVTNPPGNVCVKITSAV